MALWDIKGKALGVPVYELLGGPTRDRVRVYAGAGPTSIRQAMARGFRPAAQVQRFFAVHGQIHNLFREGG